MKIETKIFVYNYKLKKIEISIPNLEKLKLAYEISLKNDSPLAFPFWGQIWESAIALSDFIVDNNEQFQHKKVLEIAAGLGLPSLVAASYADAVICSDYAVDAFPFVEKTLQLNNIKNVHICPIDWNHIPQNIEYDMVLISDLNYEPQYFDSLYGALVQLLNKNCTIILATPQRLLAKPFIEKILPFVVYQEERDVQLWEKNKEYISLYQLKI